jgi:hypothetical protein
MDLSKLPKLSKTTESQPPPSPEAPDPMPTPASKVPQQLPTPAIGLAEAWISIGLGILLLFIFPNFLHFLFSPSAFAQQNTFNDGNGNPLTYPHTVFFWMDLGTTSFAAALIIEGIILAAARKIRPLYFAFAITTLAAIFNIIVIIHVNPINGFPLMCGVAVVVLGYMALTQLRLIKLLRM